MSADLLECKINSIENGMDDMSIENHQKISPIDFERLKMLGKGGYGRVYQVRKTTGDDVGEVYAMKVIHKSRLRYDQKDLEHIYTERDVLECVNSPFLCSLQYSFQTADQLFMVMEYVAGGEMFSHMERMSVFTEPVARFYLSEILLALEHLHLKDIVYRDLKPDNILIGRNGHIKLTDFGMCKSNMKDGDRTDTFCGTVEYMAPEIVKKRGHTKTSDYWSFGGLMYDMLLGNPPFVGETKNDTMSLIVRGTLRLPKTLSANAKDLLKKLLTRKPEERIGAVAMKSHAFFEEVDWEKVKKLETEPPFIPKLEFKEDTFWFDKEFTNASLEDPVCQQPAEGDEFGMFEGFEYTNPIFEKCVASSKKQ